MAGPGAGSLRALSRYSPVDSWASVVGRASGGLAPFDAPPRERASFYILPAGSGARARPALGRRCLPLVDLRIQISGADSTAARPAVIAAGPRRDNAPHARTPPAVCLLIWPARDPRPFASSSSLAHRARQARRAIGPSPTLFGLFWTLVRLPFFASAMLTPKFAIETPERAPCVRVLG